MNELNVKCAVPSERHLLWHKLEYYCFIHFTVNTFTGKEWGYGDESPEIFNPVDFDADEMVSIVADAGMKGLILTCKHHDGFCLWPSAFTEHSVKNSPWLNGKGDMVREFSDACKKYGVKFGVYLSPWDRNHAEYGHPAYIEYYRNQLNELTTQYGELFEVWFDGANGGDGYYGGAREKREIDRNSYYDWENTTEIVRRNQPLAVMFSDNGPDIRWVGNEHGVAGDPCWSTIDDKKIDFEDVDEGDEKSDNVQPDMVKAWASDFEHLNHGDRNGEIWRPAECDVSIRPGWFYRTEEDDKVRTPENLMDLYFKSVGRGCSLLLNLPPDKSGRLHENDVKSLLEFKVLRDQFEASNIISSAELTASQTRANDKAFAVSNLIDGDDKTYWATDENVGDAYIEIEFTKDEMFNVIELREYLPLGQRIDSVVIDVMENGEWKQVAEVQAVGNRRFIGIGEQKSSKILLHIVSEKLSSALTAIGVYNK